MTQRMMTSRERAEKIFTDGPVILGREDYDYYIKQTATQIEEAEREAVEKAHRTMAGLQTVMQRTTDLTDGYHDGYAEGFKAAREKAADKILHGKPRNVTRSYLAREIRQMEAP